MAQVLVLYYTRTGNTEGLAEAVAEGAREVGDVTVAVRRVDYANILDLATCDAVAFGSPNYFGYMAGLVKDFFDRAWSVRDSVGGKPAAAFTSGGGTSDAALLSLERMFRSFKLEKAAEGVVSSRAPSDEDLEKCRKLGKALAEAAVEKAKATPKE